MPPREVIEDDSTGNVETSGIFDPARTGSTSTRASRACSSVNNASSPARRTASARSPVVGDNGATPGCTDRGGIVVSGERLQPGARAPRRRDRRAEHEPARQRQRHVRDLVEGIMDYNFANFKLLVTSALVARRQRPRPRGDRRPRSTKQLTVANFNVENLDPGDPASKFAELAKLIVEPSPLARHDRASRRSRTTTAPVERHDRRRVAHLPDADRGDPGRGRAAVRLPRRSRRSTTRTAASRAATSASASCSGRTSTDLSFRDRPGGDLDDAERGRRRRARRASALQPRAHRPDRTRRSTTAGSRSRASSSTRASASS